MRTLGFLVGLCLIGACADSAVVQPIDAAAGIDAVLDVTTSVDTLKPDTAAPLDILADAGTDTATTADTGSNEGGFGYPCKANDDCNSGYCVPTPDGELCTKTCDVDCPQDWACKPLGSQGDTIYVCLPQYINLCRPCLANTDCTGALGNVSIGSRCIEYPDKGWFCGHDCLDAECPSGYSCKDVPDKDGDLSSQCVSDGGECTCTPYFVGLGTETWCSVANDAGVCKGKVKCVSEGMTACDAAVPEAEVCDGVDNDCDEALDEGTCEDDNVCTNDLCEGSDGCNHAPLAGTACDDVDPTTADDTCSEDGLCGGSPITCDLDVCIEASAPNGVGCDVTYVPDGSDCDDGSLDTTGDVCDGAGGCAGTLIECPDAAVEACVSAYTLTEGVCTPTYATGESCSDGDLNTTGDVCDGAGGCAGTLIECPDAAAEQCVSAYILTEGVCTPTYAAGKSCEDDSPETVNESCTDNGECVGSLPVCGDGIIEGIETCEEGNAVTEACDYGEKTCIVCDAKCQEIELAGNAYCGDGKIQDKEEGCDDGNNLEGDGCSDTCSHGSWCGVSIQNSGPPSVFLDEKTAGNLPCQGHNPAVSCPPGFLILEFQSAAANNDEVYDTFKTCVRGENFDAMLCGTSIVNSGDTSSLLLNGSAKSQSLPCKGIEPQNGCPAGYDQLVLSTASTNTDSISDTLTTCVKKTPMVDGACGVQTTNSGNHPSITVDGKDENALYACQEKVPGLGTCPPGYHALRLAMTSYNADSIGDHFTTCIYGGGECGPEGCQCDPGLSGPTCAEPTCGDKIVAGDEECEDGNLQDGDGCNASCLIENRTCKRLLDLNPILESGTYTIDIDGPGGELAFEVFCDMETDGGGWTQLMQGSALSQVFTPAVVPGHKLADAQINVLLGLAEDHYNVRMTCGNQLAYVDVKSGWASAGKVSGCKGSKYGDCAGHQCGNTPYCGLMVGTSSGKLVTSMLNPKTYGFGYKACRIHDVGDFSLNYMSR
jgi:cysteine-rich repeat protein